MLGNMMNFPLTIGSLIEHADRYHGGTEVVSVETDGTVSRSDWSTIAQNARRLASVLEKAGVAPDSRCGTIAWNNRRHLEIYFGVAASGRVCHTLNPRLTPEQMIYIVNTAADEVLLFDETFLPFAQKLHEHFKTVKHYVMLGARKDEIADTVPGLKFYDEWIAEGDATYAYPEIEETRPSSLCFTSGTTGNPKGVLYTHRSTVLHSLAGNQPDALCISATDTVMPVVPMFHVNAWGVPYVAAMSGCKLVLPGPNLDGVSLAKLIDAEEVSLALGVPTIWLGLLAGLKETGSKAKSLKRTVVGGSALPPSMIATFRDLYDVDLVHAWGMTETSPLGTLNQLLQKHVSEPEAVQEVIRQNQGRPPFGVELRVVDDNGQELPRDGKAQGILQIRGHWIIDTYFGQEASALTDDGWFDTGDIASIDEDGYLTIRDRAKDVIKSGGEWISTVELENIAISHPAIANAAAIAARHEKWDERPVVIAIKADGADIDEAALLAHFEGKVVKWQIPDRVIFVETIPLGATGKVMKNKLREEFGDVLMA